MKFSLLSAGKKAERKASIPLLISEELEEIPVILVPLTGAESSEVAVFALEYAKKNGLDEPRDGDPLYDLGAIAKTLEIATLDADSPEGARERFFDTGAEQILQDIPRETILFLFDRQQTWQDECSPSVRRITGEQLVGAVYQIVEAEDDLPFARMSPGLRWICMRTMARLLINSLGDKWPAGLLSEVTGSASSTSAPKH